MCSSTAATPATIQSAGDGSGSWRKYHSAAAILTTLIGQRTAERIMPSRYNHGPGEQTYEQSTRGNPSYYRPRGVPRRPRVGAAGMGPRTSSQLGRLFLRER